VRRANRGRVGLENTHPFTRELWGRAWTFAHNGQLKGVKKRPLKLFHPIGTTDSEHAFCWLLDQLRASFTTLPSPAALDRALGKLCQDLGTLGIFNVLMSEGRTLYAFCNKQLFYLVRQAPFGVATLVDEDLRVDFATVTSPEDRVAVVASNPLTRDEIWSELPLRTLTAFRNGAIA
jgi:predicted glutamine amidotransferase